MSIVSGCDADWTRGGAVHLQVPGHAVEFREYQREVEFEDGVRGGEEEKRKKKMEEEIVDFIGNKSENPK